MHLVFLQKRPGYVLLITVLTVGIITSTVAIAILLLGLSIERNAYSLQVSSQAYEFTMSCVERAIDSLRNDLEYEGNEQIEIEVAPISHGYGYDLNNGTNGICTIRPLRGFWNNNRTICVEATYGNFTKRRQEIVLKQVLPDTKIESWEEVPYISLCDSYSPVYCGNSITQADESCDTGNDSATCNANCTYPLCGDGYLNTSYIVPATGNPEVCDTEGESVSCDLNCSLASCGDGDLNVTRGEVCDTSGINTAICDTDCTAAMCGDGFINTAAGETCDGNGLGVGGETATCDSDCTVRSCGDGVVNITAGEQCDGGASCTGLCQIVVTVNPSDYVGYWKLDESSGDADDTASNDYDCEEKSGAGVSTARPTPITGSPVLSTRSRDFDGNNDYLKCENTNALSPNPITVSYWMYSDNTTQLYDGVMCATNGTSWSRGWGFYFGGSSTIYFFIQDYYSNRAIASITPTNQWNHVLGTWNGSTIRIYVNGVEGTSDNYSGSLTSERLEIGRCGDNNYNINGRIDDVRIFNRVLTTNEINALATGT